MANQNTPSLYRSEFPEFGEIPEADMLIAKGWTDTSWSNDVCPSFESPDQTLLVWIDAVKAEDREMSDMARFTVNRINVVDGERTFPDDCLVEVGETMADIAAAIGFTDFTADTLVALSKRQILEDIASGRVPVTVKEFADLHDHVDANEYGDFCDDTDAMIDYFGGRTESDDMPEALQDLLNEVQNAVSAWISSGDMLKERVAAVVAELSANNPTIRFEAVTKDSVSVEDEDAPNLLVSFSHDDMCIVDPFSSDCGRFPVDPTEAYGITKADADLIRAHNAVTL